MARVLVLAIGSVALAAAQTHVSIELPGKDQRVLTKHRGVYDQRNRRLLDAVADAYGTDPLHVAAPDWFRDARYDFIVDAGDDNPMPLLRRALEDKFSLNAAWETRPFATWVLERPEYAMPLSVAAPSERLSGNAASGTFTGTTTLAELARMLGLVIGAEVTDETGVGGMFHFSIKWTPGDMDSLVRALRDAGLDLEKQYRDSKVLVVYSAYWPDAPRTPRYGCEPNWELKSAIEALPSADDFRLPLEARVAPRRKLVEDYPENIFAEMAAQDAFRDDPNLSESWNRALSRYRRMQDRSAAEFLEARLLAKAQPARSRMLLSDLLKQDSGFAWAHLVSAEVAGAGTALEAGLRRFRELCPSSLADARLYDNVRDSALLHSAAEAFGRMLTGRTDDEALSAYPHYWRIRRKTGPAWPGNWLQLELARIRQLDRIHDAVWVATMKAGYELLGDQESLASFLRRIEERAPHP